jgi:hypothetical protein
MADHKILEAVSGVATGAIAERLAAARERTFVGREAELASFQAALAGAADACPVHYLQGPGGIGKSALLRSFAELARAAGRQVVEVDGRTVTPTPAAFLAAVGTGLRASGAVLLVDTFEKCQGLEGWLWEQFLPQLAEGAVAVVAGRAAPDPYWVADPGWAGLLRVTSLRNLTPDEANDFLRSRAVPDADHEAVLTFTGGNPLALALAAAVAVRPDADRSGWVPSQDAITTLLSQLVRDVPGVAHRRALEICAHAYVTSESMLREVMGQTVSEQFSWLRDQPFIEATAGGVFPHDVVREALEADLKWRDPDGFAEMHRRIHSYFFERVRSAGETEMVYATAALKFMYRDQWAPAEVDEWRNVGVVEEQPYVAEDRQRVLDIVAATEGDESAAITAFWLDRCPEAFHVYRRTSTGEVIAVLSWLRVDGSTGLDLDPVVAAAWHSAQTSGPIRPGEHIAVARCVSVEAYQRPSPSVTLMMWRMTGEMIRGERLARSYLVLRDDGFWNVPLAGVGQLPIDVRPEVGPYRYILFHHDWRALPADLWMRGQSEAFLHPGAAQPDATRRPRELVVLSRTELDEAVREVLRNLRRPDVLAHSPLNRSRVVVDSGASLADVLARTVERMRDSRGGDRRYEVLIATYFKGSPTQAMTAGRLGLPFSTYRRHLTSAVEQLTDLLWDQELNGVVGQEAPEPG